MPQSNSAVQFFYVPGEETDILSAFSSLTPNAANDRARVPSSPITSIISLSTQAENTIIYYDHWEDGLEVDIDNPIQNTTEIWGDNDPSNGIAPGFETDILSAGEAIALKNNVPLDPDRDPNTILFDGGDKVASSQVVVMTRTAWANKSGTLLAGAWEVSDTSKYGTNYTFPIGENVDSGNSQLFEYVGLTVTASDNVTTLNIDLDGDGEISLITTLNEGESYFLDGGINAGGTLSTDKPVEGHLISGNISASPDAGNTRTYYASRWFTLSPDAQWSNSYYTPVGDTATNQTDVFIYNPNDSAITVNYDYRDDANNLVTDSFTVASGDVYLHELEGKSGYHFYTDNPIDIFAAASTVSSNNIRRQGNNSTYDWGHNIVSETNLTPVVALGWSPGSDDRNKDNVPDENSSPVWVTATDKTRIYVNYSGDLTQGALVDPNGDRYDEHFDVDRLESLRIYDTSDKDMSRARIYTTDGTNLSGAWGQDPDTASGGFPAIDVGTTILPLPIATANKNVELVVDNATPDVVNPGDTIEYTVEVLNDGLAALTNVQISDLLPDGTSYVPNSSTINGETIEDNPLGTPFPFDDDLVDNGIDSGRNIGDLAVGDSAAVTYRLSIDDPYKGSVLGLINKAMISSGETFLDAKVRTHIEVPTLTKTLYLSETNDLDRINPVASQDTTTAETEVVKEEFFADNFSTAAYSNNDGSLNWSGDWFESGDDDLVDTVDARIRKEKIRIDHDDDTPPSIARKADLSGFSNAIFSFDFSTTKSVDSTDNIIVEASSDGGENYTILETITGEFTSTTSRAYNLEDFIDLTADTVVRFRIPEQTGKYGNYAGRSEFFDLDNVKITKEGTVNFNQSIPMADEFTLLEGNNVSLTAYLDVTSGALNVANPENNDISAKLTYDSGEVAALGKPALIRTVDNNIYEVSWEAIVDGDRVIPAGESINLEIVNEQNNLGFKVLYDSASYPSKVDIKTPSLIQVASVEVFDASGEGNLVENVVNTETGYIRVAVTDPFGDYDITNLDLVVRDPDGNEVVNVTLDDSSLVNDTAGDNLKTYEYAWNPGAEAALGDYQIEVTAHEGLETGDEAITYTDTLNIQVRNDISPDLVIGDSTVVEGEQLVFDFTLSDAIETDIVLDLVAVDETATNISDYDLGSLEYSADDGATWLPAGGTNGTEVTIPAGNTEIQVRVNSVDDVPYELDETFALGVANVVSGRVGNISDVGLGTITDNDPLPSISIGQVSLEEGDSDTKEFNFTVNLSNPSSQIITVDYATTDNTATVEDNDYFGTSGTLTFAPGETSQDITVLVKGDTTVELATGTIETFLINLADAVNATIDTNNSQGLGAIVDDDAVSIFAINDVTQAETNSDTTQFVFTVTRSQKTTEEVTVDYEIVDGTADSDDYTSSSGTLDFASGVTEQKITVEVNGDLIPEYDETFLINLSNPSSDGIIEDSEGQGTIVNDELGSISGQVLADIDNSDTGDEAISGVTVELQDAESNVIASTTTGEDGNYSFADLPAKTYNVVQTNLDESYSDVTANIIEITLAPGQASDGNNFVDEKLGSISGQVLVDTDNDSTGDRPIKKVTVELQNADGNVATTTTLADGSYNFANVPVGTYNVVQTNLDDTYLDVGDADGGNPNSIEVALPVGGTSENNNFIDEQPGVLHGTSDADTIDGTNDDDIFIGYEGADTLMGGAGRDSFVFKSLDDGVDLITDFTPGEDRVEITELLENEFNYTGDDPVADGYVHFAECFGGAILQIDSDGDGVQPYETLAFVYGASSTDTNILSGEPIETPPSSEAQGYFFFSLKENSYEINGNSYRDEDIVAFDGQEFQLFFDGSDVGVGPLDLDAVDIVGDSEVLLSFSTPTTITIDGVDTKVDDSDIVKFTGTSMGEVTEGSFEMFFDGSEFGLTGDLQDIDGIQLLNDDNLLISTIGSSSTIIEGVRVSDEDILRVEPLAPNTTTWSMYLDGGDVGLNDNDSEDINALSVTTAGKVAVSTVGDVTVADQGGNDFVGNNVSVLEFTPSGVGEETSGSFNPILLFDGTEFGLTAENINAMSFESLTEF